MANEKVIVKQTTNKVIVTTPGPQGPRGRTILNGVGAPSNNLGIQGDFYYNTDTTDFYGPKLSDTSWSGATVIKFIQEGSDYAYSTSWELSQVLAYPPGATGNQIEYWYIDLSHDLGFYPNVTIKTSAGDILETGIEYNSINSIKLTMAQPFAGTAYLS
jgi:hypothetical protein